MRLFNNFNKFKNFIAISNDEEDHMQGSFLGQDYSDKDIKSTLDGLKVNYKRYDETTLWQSY